MKDMKLVQDRVRDLSEINELLHNVETSYINLVDQVNDIGKEIIKSTEYGRNKVEVTENLKEGVGSTIVALLALCNSMDVSGRELSLEVLSKYEDDLYD